MKYCLLEIAYDNSFHGFQKQPSVRTVQGEILNKLAPLGINKIYGSSRTDAGVRSSSTIIEIQHDDCNKICRVVDSISGIYVLSYAQSDNFIRLRGNLIKSYLFIHIEPLNEDLLKNAINDFIHSNISNFSREPEKKVFLEKLNYKILNDHTLLIFTGKSFSWNFVRISAELIIRRANGEIDDSEWNELLNGRRRYRFKGKASNLILFRTNARLELRKYNSPKIKKLYENYLIQYYWLKGMGIQLNVPDKFIEELRNDRN